MFFPSYSARGYVRHRDVSVVAEDSKMEFSSNQDV